MSDRQTAGDRHAEPDGWVHESHSIGASVWKHEETGTKLWLSYEGQPPDQKGIIELDGKEAYTWTSQKDEAMEDRAVDAMKLYEPGMGPDELENELKGRYNTGLGDFE